jgi:UDP-N-acetylmuramoyl-tripeptide--D-alanyl-D-alanine ligase
MRLFLASEILNAEFFGTNADISFKGISTDTRTLQPGDLFIALRGDNFDGHNFVAEAQQRGAVAAIVRHKVAAEIPQLCVEDTLRALGKLGAWRREQFSVPILTVTGSCGKTTTKEILATILRNCGNTLVSIKSYNNEIGVPLTLWQLNQDHQFAVLEVGANHFGEISYLTNLIKPQVAVITNAAACHLEGFGGSVAGVAKGKGEIFEGLAMGGTAVLHVDDEYFTYWKSLLKPWHNLITFGINNKAMADVSVADLQFNSEGQAQFVLLAPQFNVPITLPLLGKHNVYNALAAVAVALAVGASSEAIKTGLETVAPVKMRFVSNVGYKGAKIIDDTYNANPSAVQAALDLFQYYPGKKLLVLGDMLELGDEACFLHQQIGEMIAASAIDNLYTYGKFGEIVARAFSSKCRDSQKQAYAFTDKAELTKAIRKAIDANTTVLIKGSRGMKMEEVVAGLLVSK